MKDLSEASQEVVNKLLYGPGKEHKEALAKLPTLADKDHVATFMVQCLCDEQDGPTRSWFVSGLAAINAPGTADIVAKHLDPGVEEFFWARYYAAIGLNKMHPANLQTHLTKAVKDPEELVQAVALRLLIENGFDDGHIEQLSKMITSKRWEARWAACKALRRDVGHRPLQKRIEKLFIPMLVERLEDDREVMDVRFQAALALGNMTHELERAIEVLGRALKGPLPDWIRRGCVDALAQIAKPEAKEALLGALLDEDAEIRARAAKGLESAMDSSGAVSFIVEELLRQEEPPRQYFDALRQIDGKAAANVLAAHLLHPDSKIAERTARALARLGGDEAVRTLQAQRTKALDTYTQLLGDADHQIMQQFNSLMGRAQRAFTMSLWMHGLIFAIGMVVLGVSLYVALSKDFASFERFVGIGTTVGSLGTLLLLFYKNPLKNIRDSVTNLIKANIVFLGYVRQINQIDATFKHMFLTPTGFGIDQMKQTVKQLQDAIKATMEEVKTHLGTE